MKTILCCATLLLFAGVFTACDKKHDDPTEATGQLILEFDNRVGTDNLTLHTTDQPYQNALGQSFNVSTLKYYISNIRLKTADGQVFEDAISADGAEGYYLIDEAKSDSRMVTLTDVPVGDYTELTFTLGVDANRVDQGAQTGALDVANNMFWSWNMGYVFLMMEGASAASPEDDGEIGYHVGGYKTDTSNPNLVDNLKEITLSFNGNPATVRENVRPEAHLYVDVLEFFKTPTTVDFSVNPHRHSPASCADIADNYVDAFSVNHIHN
ncbi:hypothetical protein SAMN05421823_1313 [Catalinimonas alkaloidigena]|uniref:Copper-binding protein MbnP-like domain-containing protein n=1 Tax=Catalinimonas alkaloidigena TaxID=1075417 RepID=A0A1G9W2L8_9BACT|nr:MbnP family protein [Catalinimonas alkaloidigena]SDM78553.1 hypothetical protein SAMN05421823_1313 [Catalinimonas alkaloidigena]